MAIRYGSVCSGIEAATVAWEPLGWEAAWFSEIEPMPCALLKYRWPHVPNLGDMTTLEARILAREIEAPDVLVGGTPCQSFSLSGLRGGLDDARGNLTLVFVRLANAIDAVRSSLGKPPCFVVWENVPGIFSDAGNAFGSLLAGLVGSESALAPRGGWTGAGVASGPSRVAAWRTMDAQFFGVAQRRRRIFVVARGGPRRWTAADALLPIAESVRWCPEPRRGSREEDPRTSTGSAGVGSRRGVELPAVAGTLGALTKGSGFRSTDLDGQGAFIPEIAGTLGADGGGARSANLDGGGAFVPEIARTLTANDGGVDLFRDVVAETFCANAEGSEGLPFLTASNLEKGVNNQTPLLAEPIPFDETQITSPENRSRPQHGDPAPTLAKSARPPAIASRIVESPPGRRWRVRRLTELECERLQAFPDGHTRIPGASSSARYRSLGNSMCVFVMRRIGRKIARVEGDEANGEL